jgi:hypothetical protein
VIGSCSTSYNIITLLDVVRGYQRGANPMWSDCIIGAIKKQSENIGHRKLALRVDNVYIDLVTTNQIICFTKSLI